MEKINDSYELSTGKVIHPNRGIIGLTEHGGFKIYEGYDNSWLTSNDDVNKKYIELTDLELIEIAAYMGKLWNEYEKQLRKSIIK